MSVAIEPSAPSLWPRGRAVPGAGPRAAAIERLFARLTAVALVMCVASDVFGGATRFALAMLGMPVLSYLPMVFSACLAIAYFTYQGTVSRLDLRILAILGFFLAYTIYSVLTDAAGGVAVLGRVAFALYTWTPFFLGLMLASQNAELRLVRYAVLWWAVAIVGVVVNRFVHFPWAGSTIEVLGQESQVARDWTTNGLERLAGFSRASYTAANEIAVFGILIITRPRTRRMVRATVWILSVAAIVLTTAKTPLMTMLLVPLALWIQRRLPDGDGRGGDVRFLLAMGTLAALIAAMVILPASSATEELLFKYSFGDVGFLTLSSMLDRTTAMWPSAFALIADDHNAFEWAFGRGLGGIGAAQTIFEPLDFNSADNMFVFLYVTFGANCVVFGLAIFSGFRAVYRLRDERFVLFFALAASVLTLGLASNVIESIVPALALGLLAGKSSRSAIGRGEGCPEVVARADPPPGWPTVQPRSPST